MKKSNEQKFVVVSIVLTLCLNIPFLLLFDGSESSLLGMPKGVFYILLCWLLSIVVVFILSRKSFDE